MSFSKRSYGVVGYGTGAGRKRAKAEIIGIEQLEGVLNKFPYDISQKKVLATSVRIAGKPLAERAKRNLKMASDIMGSPAIKLEDQFMIKPLSKNKTWRAGYIYGWSVRKADAVYKIWKVKDRSRAAWAFRGAMWLEWGASGVGRWSKYAGTHYRQIQPMGWFRRAVDSSISGVQKDFKISFHKTVNRALNKYIKKYAA